MTAHPHSSGNKPGSYQDHVERPDAQFGGIGKHFTPMVETAPIGSLTVRHRKVHCRACGAKTWHAAGHDIPKCAWAECGAELSEADAGEYA
jgi:hypothetical protein